MEMPRLRRQQRQLAVFILEVNAADPLTFRWSDDLARTWKGTKVPDHVRLAAAQRRRGDHVQAAGRGSRAT